MVGTSKYVRYTAVYACLQSVLFLLGLRIECDKLSIVKQNQPAAALLLLLLFYTFPVNASSHLGIFKLKPSKSKMTTLTKLDQC